MADYVTRVLDDLQDIAAKDWDALLQIQSHPTPFMQHAYLHALQRSGCASPDTGWTGHAITLHDAQGLAAACPVYLKDHSYGEYVFDWAWARAYQDHGLAYYPKALVAVPFTPVPGTRLMARDDAARKALIQALLQWCEGLQLSSLHLLFASSADMQCCTDAGLLQRQTLQFHWENTVPGYTSFEQFLGALSQDKRKKIRQERRKVQEAGVEFHHLRGAEISAADWDFFYRCYERTYLEHGNLPYLSRAFFSLMAQDMPGNWLMFIARRGGQPIASSLIALQDCGPATAYGRYWGALERVDCLHFEACYYQPLQWCIAHGYQRFEGGAQGEHKMARALMPVSTSSAHWLSHPAFADAVERFLEREGNGISQHLQDLQARSPFRKPVE